MQGFILEGGLAFEIRGKGIRCVYGPGRLCIWQVSLALHHSYPSEPEQED